jgi:hypothetical protein
MNPVERSSKEMPNCAGDSEQCQRSHSSIMLYKESELKSNFSQCMSTEASKVSGFKWRRSSLNATQMSDTSMILENTSAIARKDENGNKYINKYKLQERLGK